MLWVLCTESECHCKSGMSRSFPGREDQGESMSSLYSERNREKQKSIQFHTVHYSSIPSYSVDKSWETHVRRTKMTSSSMPWKAAFRIQMLIIVIETNWQKPGWNTCKNVVIYNISIWNYLDMG